MNSGFTKLYLLLYLAVLRSGMGSRLASAQPATLRQRRRGMRATFAKLMTCIGAAALVLTVTHTAAAQCGMPSKPIKRMNWSPMYRGAHPSLLRTGFGQDNDNDDGGAAIVGMWHVKFTAQSQNGETIPGGAVIDNSVVVWHPDGTEIMNSSRPAQDGNFCLGVWKRTGKRSYLLNHMPWQGNVFNPAAAPDLVGPPQGGDQIIENVTLSPDGKSYSGTFTLRAYDTFGNVYVWFAGTLSATRITPDTPFTDLL